MQKAIGGTDTEFKFQSHKGHKDARLRTIGLARLCALCVFVFTPNIMLRRGFTKNSLDVGTELSVEGYQAKNGSNRANGSSVTFRDGRRLFVGGSNPDVPEDQKR